MNQFAYSAIALGQHFINKNSDFAREMALAVLSMRKYYKENRPFTDMKSTIEAPAYAIRKSTEIFAEFSEEIEKMEKEELE